MKDRSRNRRCGLRRLFVFMLAAVLFLGSLPALAEEKNGAEPFKGTVSLKLSTHGFGLTGAAAEYLKFSLAVDTEKKAADLNIALIGKGVDILFAWDNGSPRFSVPALGTAVYEIGKDALAGILAAAEQLRSQNSAQSAATDTLLKKIKALTESYASPETVTEEAGTYSYVLLSGTEEGTRYTMTLSKEQWKSFWRQFLTILNENNALKAALAQNKGMLPAEFSGDLTPTEKNLEDLAEQTRDWQLVLFHNGDTVYSFWLGDETSGLLLENSGSLRTGMNAALGIKKNGSLRPAMENTMMLTDAAFFGRMKIADLLHVDYSLESLASGKKKILFDLSFRDKGLSLEGVYSPGSVAIPMPGAANSKVSTVDELTKVLGEAIAKVFLPF